jgi:hypothetical protein
MRGQFPDARRAGQLTGAGAVFYSGLIVKGISAILGIVTGRWCPTLRGPFWKGCLNPFETLIKVCDMIGQLMDRSGHVGERFSGWLLRTA